MGNCTDRYSPDDKRKHYCKEATKNDKMFIQSSVDPEILPETSQSIPHFESMKKKLKREKKHFSSLVESDTKHEKTNQRLVVEIQKGQEMYKPRCLGAQFLLIRTSLSPDGPYFDTPLAESELPVWNFLSTFNESINKYKQVTFCAFLDVPKSSLKSLGHSSISIKQLASQMVWHDWLSLEDPVAPNNPKLLVKLQWVFDEYKLYEAIILECDEKLEKLKESLDKVREQ